MTTILLFGITIILFLQGLGGWLALPMKIFTFFGEEQFFLFFMPIVFWCFDSALGFRLGMALLLSNGLNSFLKMAMHAPRPFWIDTQVKAMRFENGFGIPSGHAQISASFWGTFALALRRVWVWVVASLVILLIGLSRLYLGVHFPSDVVVGWLIGALLAWLIYALEKPVLVWLRKQGLAERILVAFAVSLLMLLLGVVVKLTLRGWQIPEVWLRNAALAYPDLEPGQKAIDPFNLSGMVSTAGTFFGMACGGILLWNAGGFNAHGLWWKRVVRFLVGLVGVGAFYFFLDMVFPDGEALIPMMFRYLRYGLTGLWVTGMGPWVFMKIGLAEKNRGSEVKES